MPPKIQRKTEAMMGGTDGHTMAISSGIKGVGKLFGLSDGDMEILEARVAKTVPSRHQHRRVFDQEKMNELADSIVEKGLLEPIGVRPFVADGYPVYEGMPENPEWEIVFGERRWRAFGLLKRETIPAVKKQQGNPVILALIENIQREDPDPLEYAEGLQRLIDAEGVTQVALAKMLNCSEASVSVTLKLVTLPSHIKEEFWAEYRKTVSHSALSLVAEEKEPEAQLALWERIKSGATIRELREIRDDLRQGRGGKEGGGRVPPTRSLNSRIQTTVGKTTNNLAKLLSGDKSAIDEESRGKLRELRDTLNSFLEDGK